MATTLAPSSSGRLIDLNPGLAEKFQAFADAVFDADAANPVITAAAALGAAIAFNRQDSVRSYLAAAKQAGLTNEDIGRIAAAVDVIRIESHQRPGGAATSAEHQHQPKASKSCC